MRSCVCAVSLCPQVLGLVTSSSSRLRQAMHATAVRLGDRKGIVPMLSLLLEFVICKAAPSLLCAVAIGERRVAGEASLTLMV